MSVQSQKPKIIEVLTFIVVTLNVLVTLGFSIFYTADYQKASTKLAEVQNQIAQQDLQSKKIESEYTKEVKEQQNKLNELDISLKENNRILATQQISQNIIPKVVITGSIDAVSTINTAGKISKIITFRFSLANNSTQHVFVDATAVRLYVFDIDKNIIESRKVFLVNRQATLPYWNLIHEINDAHSAFKDRIKNYNYQSIKVEKIDWNIKNPNDDQYLTGDLNQNSPRSDFRTFIIPYDLLLACRAEITVFYRFQNEKSEDNFYVRTFLKEAFFGNN